MKVFEKYKNEIDEATKQGRTVIACMCNNEVKSLNFEIKDTDKVTLLDTSTKDGHRIYIRGILYIMAKALEESYPTALLSVNYQLANAMFCKIENMEITEEMIQKIEARMQEIIDQNLEIRKVEMDKEEAKEFYRNTKSQRGMAQFDNYQKEMVSLYYCENYYNYFFGVMPISTGYTNVFDIKKYKDGFLVRYPAASNPHELSNQRSGKKLLATLEEYEDIHKVLNIHNLYNLNNEIEKGNGKDIILLSEALHEKKIADIADDILHRKGIKMVLIAGPSSSGKTTFAHRLGIQLRLNGLKPVTISVDNYFVERENNPKDENGNYDFECIEAIDTKLFNEHILKLLNGEEIDVPTFDFEVGTKRYNGEKMRLKDDQILVIEGIHCLNDKLTSLIPKDQKYKIYISCLTVLNVDFNNRISTTDSRLIRRIVRDNQFRGYSALHTLRMWDSVNRGEEKNIFPFQEEADSIFNTSLIYELGVLRNEAIPLLEKITKDEKEYAEAQRLIEILRYFEPISKDIVPSHSLLKEFLGGGDFKG